MQHWCAIYYHVMDLLLSCQCALTQPGRQVHVDHWCPTFWPHYNVYEEFGVPCRLQKGPPWHSPVRSDVRVLAALSSLHLSNVWSGFSNLRCSGKKSTTKTVAAKTKETRKKHLWMAPRCQMVPEEKHILWFSLLHSFGVFGFMFVFYSSGTRALIAIFCRLRSILGEKTGRFLKNQSYETISA
jgi:hypothetical protein